MSAETYEKLAKGASDLLAREVTVSELLGVAVRHFVPVSSKIGAGEMVYPIDGDPNIGQVEAPIADTDQAWEVDGDSMWPVYRPRDKLFPSRRFADPKELVGRIVGVQIRNGPRVVKELRRGTQKGKWTLVSINPKHPPLENQTVEWVAKIGAVVFAD